MFKAVAVQWAHLGDFRVRRADLRTRQLSPQGPSISRDSSNLSPTCPHPKSPVSVPVFTQETRVICSQDHPPGHLFVTPQGPPDLRTTNTPPARNSRASVCYTSGAQVLQALGELQTFEALVEAASQAQTLQGTSAVDWIRSSRPFRSTQLRSGTGDHPTSLCRRQRRTGRN